MLDDEGSSGNLGRMPELPCRVYDRSAEKVGELLEVGLVLQVGIAQAAGAQDVAVRRGGAGDGAAVQFGMRLTSIFVPSSTKCHHLTGYYPYTAARRRLCRS